MSARRDVIDVSELPSHAFGARDPLWWGVMFIIMIELTGFAMLAVTYFYLRGNFVHWPPTPMSTQSLVAAALGTAALLASVFTTSRMCKAARAEHVSKVTYWLGLTFVLAVVAMICRALEFAGLPFAWDRHAYGSSFWLMLGMHTTHGITGVIENGVVLLLFVTRERIENKHLVDAHTNGIYWYFVALSWVPIACVLYAEPLLFGG